MEGLYMCSSLMNRAFLLQCLPKTVPAPAPHPAMPAVPAPHSIGRHLRAEPLQTPVHRRFAPAPGPHLQPTKPARRSANSHVPEFFICGGMGDACPLNNRELCADAQYMDCPSGASCVRQSRWYWQVISSNLQAKSLLLRSDNILAFIFW